MLNLNFIGTEHTEETTGTETGAVSFVCKVYNV